MISDGLDRRLRISPFRALILFICWWVLLSILGSVIINFIGAFTIERIRWAVVVQDLFVFILPVVASTVIMAVDPKKFCGVFNRVNVKTILTVAAIVILAIPALNRIVAWNESIHLPESFATVENILRGSEERARDMVNGLMAGTSWLDLIISILIMGLLTGLAEELFFRGTLQPLLKGIMRNHHAAIWATAIIFSALHMQFFGFVPRMLMGAFFGYLVYWSGSLRSSIFAHALNNSLVVLNYWLYNRGILPVNLDTIGVGPSGLTIAIVSAATTAIAIWLLATKVTRR